MVIKWNRIINKIPNPSACLNVCSKSFVIARDDAPDENKVFLIFEGAVCRYEKCSQTKWRKSEGSIKRCNKIGVEK